MRTKRGITWALFAAIGAWPLAAVTCTIDPSDIALIILRDDDDDDHDDHHGFHFHDDDHDPIMPWEFDRIHDIDF